MITERKKYFKISNTDINVLLLNANPYFTPIRKMIRIATPKPLNIYNIWKYIAEDKAINALVLGVYECIISAYNNN